MRGNGFCCHVIFCSLEEYLNNKKNDICKMEFCPKIIHLKNKKYQSNTFFKIKPKLVFKTGIGDYGFNFKLKTIVNNYGFKLVLT